MEDERQLNADGYKLLKFASICRGSLHESGLSFNPERHF